MSMNFATLEESALFLPFTRSSILCFTHILLNFWHRAGVRQYTFFFKFALSCVFIKQSQPKFCATLFFKGPPLFRSYGACLPSSFKFIISNALAVFCLFTSVGFKYGLCDKIYFLEKIFFNF